MKLIFGIALMLGDGAALGVMTALMFALAVQLALPLLDWAFLTQDGGENFLAH